MIHGPGGEYVPPRIPVTQIHDGERTLSMNQSAVADSVGLHVVLEESEHEYREHGDRNLSRNENPYATEKSFRGLTPQQHNNTPNTHQDYVEYKSPHTTHTAQTARPSSEKTRNPVEGGIYVNSAREKSIRPESDKVMLNEDESTLFSEEESFLHGGRAKTIAHRDWESGKTVGAYRDREYAVFFLANLAVVAFCFILFRFILGDHSSPAQHSFLGRDVSIALYFSGTIALGLAFLWLAVLKVASDILIKAVICITFALTVALSLFSFIKGGILTGFVLLVLVGAEGLYARYVWSRAQLASATVEVTVSFTSNYPGVFIVAATSLLVQLIWLMFWSSASFHTMVYFAGSTMGQLMGLYLIFMLFWVNQVICNLVHVTIAGSFGSWYYGPRKTETTYENPTRIALNRACGKSFGSVCLGSLLVAIVRILRNVVDLLKRGYRSK